MKQCNKCEKWKSLSAFVKQTKSKDNLNYWCKVCMKKYRQTRKTQRNECSRKYQKTLIGYLRIRFQAIKHRCNNPNNLRYKDYGGRGIKCLFEDAGKFVDYVLNDLKIDPRGLSIDRIDNDGNYEKGNIRFVTQAENNKNKRRTV